MSKICAYLSPDGKKCTESCESGNLCFWHNPDIDKSGQDLTQKLEAFVRNGGVATGLKLKRANLSGINLVNHGHKTGFDLSGSDFYRADLRGAHLFNLKLKNGSLMKADLREANLHCADFTDTNLLGVKLSDATLDNLLVGTQLSQEAKARHCRACKDHLGKDDNLEQAEEIYRNLRKHAESQGLFSFSGHCNYKELTLRRARMPRWSGKWLFSHIIDALCGYGEKPENTVFFAFLLILTSALGYFFLGIKYEEQTLAFSTSLSLLDNLSTFFLSLYYSLVTFTTLGYGDVTPVGYSRILAAIEVFLGTFSIALFVVVFVKRMTR